MAFFKTYQFNLIIFFAVLLGNNCKAQADYFFYYNDFTVDISEKDVIELNFVEDSIFSFLENGLHSEYYFHDDITSFSVPLTKAEGLNIFNSKNNNTALNKYSLGLIWKSNYRSFFITSFSRNYLRPDYLKYDKTLKGRPLISFPISSYNEIFSKIQNSQIQIILKTNVLLKIDSNYNTLNDFAYNTIREISIDSNKIFPQAPLEILFDLIKENIFEKNIYTFNNNLCDTLIDLSTLRNQYLEEQRGYVQKYNQIEYDSIYYKLERICASILLSENIKVITDSIIDHIKKPFYFKHKAPIPYFEFKYNAIGFKLISNETKTIKVIWLKYNDVKKLMIDNKINFELYEAIFTKHLFEKLKVNNYYWQDSDYLKK